MSLVAEDTRATWGWPLFEQFAQDAAYALRSLRRTPGFTAAAVVTLALGIGVNTAIFSVVNGVLLNPLPYPEPDRLVALYSRTADEPRASSSYPNFLDWARDNRSFSDLAAFRADDLNLIGLGQPERVPGGDGLRQLLPAARGAADSRPYVPCHRRPAGRGAGRADQRELLAAEVRLVARRASVRR